MTANSLTPADLIGMEAAPADTTLTTARYITPDDVIVSGRGSRYKGPEFTVATVEPFSMPQYVPEERRHFVTITGTEGEKLVCVPLDMAYYVRHHTPATDAAAVLARFDAWATAREDLSAREDEGRVSPDEWHASDDTGTDLAHDLAAALRTLAATPPPEEPLYSLTREDVAEYAGRPLTDDEAARFAETFPLTSVDECIGGWLDGAGINSDNDTED